MIDKKSFPVAPEGIHLILIFAALTAVFAGIGYYVVAALLAVFTLFNAYFFRNPQRTAPDGPVLVAPADGVVILVKPVVEDRFLKSPATKISIFMNVFNVHVNRAPYDGEVTAVKHADGKFLSADLDAATEENEQNAVLLRMSGGLPVLFVQVAGLIARRIVCDVKPGDRLVKGERFGLICYGSRVDVYLPPSVAVRVAVGDKTRSGETIIGELTT